jgi:CRISPR-associated protein Csh1
MIFHTLDFLNNLILSQLSEYQDFCFSRLVSFGKIDSKNVLNYNCYLDSDIREVYAVEFPRDNVNILKTATASVTSTPYFQGNSFLLSRESYDAIKLGAKYIDKTLKLRISNVLHYVVPEFINEIDINKLKTNLSDKIELAFSTSDFRKTNRDLRRLSGNNVNSVVLVGCIKGKGDIDFVNSIRISSVKYFDSIFDEFDKAKLFSDTFFKYPFSFKSIYNLFPVSTDKNKQPESLFFFKAILERNLIEASFLIDAYIKLINIYRYRKPTKEGDKLYPGTINIAYKSSISFDSRIEIATKKYLALLNLISKIYKMENQNIELDNSNKSKTEIFFNECNYGENNAKKALFYLGKLIRKVALAQNKQQNGNKPILDKINYSGMSPQEIQWLFCEVIEKLKQYHKKYRTLDSYSEEDMKSFSKYFALADKDSNSWKLTNQENTFFLFTGYSMFFDVIEKKHEDIIQKEGYSHENDPDEDENNDEQESSEDAE